MTVPNSPERHDTTIESAGVSGRGVAARCSCGWLSDMTWRREIAETDALGHVLRHQPEPRIADATEDDLRLAIAALGPKAMYGGLLSCCLAGIYAERQHASPSSVAANLAVGGSTEREGQG